jgi:hypothetical protein
VNKISIQPRKLNEAELCKAWAPVYMEKHQRKPVFLKPPNDIQETKNWQPVSSNEVTNSTARPAKYYVFSAFYDSRWNPPAVLILGLASSYEINNHEVFCRMWFLDESEPATVKAHFRFVPEAHGRK